jgi:hypothetical protein
MTLVQRTQGRSPGDDEDEERLEPFPAPTVRHVILKLLGVLMGVTLAALVLSLVGQTTGQSLLSQLFTGPLSSRPDQPPGQTNESFTPAQLPAVTEKPAVADRRTPSTPPPGASTPANATGAPPKAGTGQGASSGPRLSAPIRPSPRAPAPSNQVATAPAPEVATPKATPQVGSSHRAELLRKPVSRGWGDSYAVRLLDPAGKPLVVAQVFLVAHLADGSVEYIAMGALPEPGTYRGTVSTGHSTPVDLRIRVSTGDKFVEVPVRR